MSTEIPLSVISHQHRICLKESFLQQCESIPEFERRVIMVLCTAFAYRADVTRCDLRITNQLLGSLFLPEPLGDVYELAREIVDAVEPMQIKVLDSGDGNGFSVESFVRRSTVTKADCTLLMCSDLPHFVAACEDGHCPPGFVVMTLAEGMLWNPVNQESESL